LLSEQPEPVHRVQTGSYLKAKKQLCRHFARSRLLALLHCNGLSGASYLIDRFLAGIADDVTVVRLTDPCSDELSAMCDVIRGIGFDPADLSLADLEGVFSLFLSFQKKHGCRTVLCVEATKSSESWLLSMVRRMVEQEVDEEQGLLVVVSGPTSLLDELSAKSRHCIYLAPLTLVETREFLRWHVESTGTARIAQVLEFDAITRIHEITNGEPDAVMSLLSMCLELDSKNDPKPISVDLVNRASGAAELQSLRRPELEAVALRIVDQFGPRGGRLVVRASDDVTREYSLERGHVLIGRGKLCDVRISSASVSRHHALVISSPVGTVLVDLESTNGTFVDGQRIKEYLLETSGVVTIGNCDVEVARDDEQDGWVLDLRAVERSESYDDDGVTQTLKCWDNAIKGNINSKGEKIYHVPGSAKYNATKIDESNGERWFASEDEAIAAGWRAPRTHATRTQ
jgi:pSer/pThr/pTyr-binding forkhead associated (FHA) protein